MLVRGCTTHPFVPMYILFLIATLGLPWNLGKQPASSSDIQLEWSAEYIDSMYRQSHKVMRFPATGRIKGLSIYNAVLWGQAGSWEVDFDSTGKIHLASWLFSPDFQGQADASDRDKRDR